MTQPERSAWDALAEEFGLEGGNRPEAPAKPAPEPVAPPVAEEAPSRGRRRRAVEVEEVVAPPEPLPEPAPAPAPVEAPVAEAKPELPQALDEEGEERGRPRRRRGRRRGGSKAPEEAAAEQEAPKEPKAVAEPAAATEPDGDEPAEEPRRRRGRGRGRKPKTPEAVAPESVESSEDNVVSESVPEVPTRAADEDDDEPPSFTNWNVPSWQELISSLYRPER